MTRVMVRHAKYARIARVATTLPLYRVMPNKAGYMAWLRSELEAAGCLFVKMGQWVSSRTDVFAPEVTEALSELRQDVAPMPPRLLAKVLEESGLVFEAFDDRPIKCGSMAQVHTARWRGKRVAVKLRRANALEDLESDTHIIRTAMAPLRLFGSKTVDDAMRSLDDLCATVARETDFELESANMAVFASFFRREDWVRIPEVIATAPGAIVMDYIPSTPITSKAMIDKLMELFVVQLFDLGYLHTDLHAGNVGVDAQGRLVVYDFGSVQRCSEELRTCLKRLVVSYPGKNPRLMLDLMVEHRLLTHVDLASDSQREALEGFIATVLQYVDTTDIRAFQKNMVEIMAPAAMKQAQFSPEVLMVFRSFTLLEGLCKSLDPEFVIRDSVAPIMLSQFFADPDMYRFKIEEDVQSVRDLFT